jgi:hypothetical protein
MIDEHGAVAVMVHYLTAERIVCMPNLPPERFAASIFRPAPVLRSDDVRAVNCPACRRTFQYQAALASLRAAGVVP